jgi:hypothetical protein
MILSIRRNERVEKVGERVHWLKFRRADVTWSFWKGLPRIFVSLHPPAPLHDSPKGEVDLFNQCPRCESGRRIMPGQQGDLMHAIFLCLDCNLIFNLRHLMYRN